MLKPTSRLITEIIEFVSQQQSVSTLLNQRDNHPMAAAVEVTCRFLRHDQANPARSAYDVKFMYATKDAALEKDDDIRVRVVVTDGPSPTFQLVDIDVA